MGNADRTEHAQANAAWPSPRLVYARQYNIGVGGLERLHPFDSRKYGRAWKLLRNEFGHRLNSIWVKPSRAVNQRELMGVHSPSYLQRLRDTRFVSQVLEVPHLGYLPGWAVDWAVLRPMRWATMGSIIAAREALSNGIAINLSGGYHHASPDDGHGFSAYADAGLAVQRMRQEGSLSETAKVVYVDLDAHQGNGVCRTFFDDPRVFIYDQYNRRIFPHDLKAQRRIDCDVPMDDGCTEAQYLSALGDRLPNFLDAITLDGDVKLAIYNAGTDVFEHDALGGMLVSADGVLERDRFVMEELIGRKVPTMVLLSGGYSRESYQLVAQMVKFVVTRWGR